MDKLPAALGAALIVGVFMLAPLLYLEARERKACEARGGTYTHSMCLDQIILK